MKEESKQESHSVLVDIFTVLEIGHLSDTSRMVIPLLLVWGFYLKKVDFAATVGFACGVETGLRTGLRTGLKRDF